MVVFASIIIMQAVIVYIHPDACASQFIEQLGIAPLQFLLSVMMLARSWYAAPVIQQPQQLLTSEKQQFSWCEGDVARAMAQRGCADTEPMFCFETALRSLFWTIAAYRETQVMHAFATVVEEDLCIPPCKNLCAFHHSAVSHHCHVPPCNSRPNINILTSSAVHSTTITSALRIQDIHAGEPVFTVGNGCTLRPMDGHRIERWDSEDLAALVGWGRGHVIVSFRGSVSMR